MLPVAAVAAMSAAENGVSRSVPRPKPFSARARVESPGWMAPVSVVMPAMSKSRPMPYCRAAVGSASSAIRAASMANVVLQECENAVVAVTVPSEKPSLWIVRLFVVHSPGQATMVVGVMRPASIAAVAVTILNVEPGG